MDLIFDTHALFWISVDHPKLSGAVARQLEDPDTRTFVSVVTAWEYGDLLARRRLPGSARLEDLQRVFAFDLLDFPASAHVWSDRLPPIHRDPIDRMLIAHALVADLVLVTADEKMRRYPVKSLW